MSRLLYAGKLGEEAEVDLRRCWRDCKEPVAANAPAEERYEGAYRNLMSVARTNDAFIREYTAPLKIRATNKTLQ